MTDERKTVSVDGVVVGEMIGGVELDGFCVIHYRPLPPPTTKVVEEGERWPLVEMLLIQTAPTGCIRGWADDVLERRDLPALARELTELLTLAGKVEHYKREAEELNKLASVRFTELCIANKDRDEWRAKAEREESNGDFWREKFEKEDKEHYELMEKYEDMAQQRDEWREKAEALEKERNEWSKSEAALEAKLDGACQEVVYWQEKHNELLMDRMEADSKSNEGQRFKALRAAIVNGELEYQEVPQPDRAVDSDSIKRLFGDFSQPDRAEGQAMTLGSETIVELRMKYPDDTLLLSPQMEALCRVLDKRLGGGK